MIVIRIIQVESCGIANPTLHDQTYQFIENLDLIQRHLIKATKFNDDQDDSCIEFRYNLGNIYWNNLIPFISNRDYNDYSDDLGYFIQVINNTIIINDYVINRPLELQLGDLDYYKLIKFNRNKLLLLDALLTSGAQQLYTSATSNHAYYSEHSGTLILDKSKSMIDAVNVTSESIPPPLIKGKPSQDNILYPKNTAAMKQDYFMFHTHPLEQTYISRLDSHVIYEFPSADDIKHFMFFYNIGNVQASVIITPEGIYVIKPIKHQLYPKSHKQLDIIRDNIHEIICDAEDLAIEHYTSIYGTNLESLKQADQFHNAIGNNIEFIRIINTEIFKYNIAIDYYPRVKDQESGMWLLREFNLELVVDLIKA
ncbi:Hypothetical protein MVR_LOCUS223 [uncultured virus]|nr:Hypothetical protein MVR_LOCUS223 [uncultured virus]